jgi:hypothetical protein
MHAVRALAHLANCHSKISIPDGSSAVTVWVAFGHLLNPSDGRYPPLTE